MAEYDFHLENKPVAGYSGPSYWFRTRFYETQTENDVTVEFSNLGNPHAFDYYTNDIKLVSNNGYFTTIIQRVWRDEQLFIDISSASYELTRETIQHNLSNSWSEEDKWPRSASSALSMFCFESEPTLRPGAVWHAAKVIDQRR
jgi:hypothetical protein